MAATCKKPTPRFQLTYINLKATRWLSSDLEEARAAAQDHPLSWLGSEDVPDSPIMKLLGAAGLDELRTRASAASDPSFRTQRESDWKMLEGSTPALKRGGRRGRD